MSEYMSEKINEIASALVEVQKVITGAKKDKKNPHLKNNYADLSSVWDACRVPLTDNGLAITQLIEGEGDKVAVRTMIVHTSGQWIASRGVLPRLENKGINAGQAMGSAISYMRRYALAAIVGVTQEDDDASSIKDEPAKATEPVKDVTYWKAQADANVAHIVNLKNWYNKHEAEIKQLPVSQQDAINLHIKGHRERLEKQLADKKAAEESPAEVGDSEALAKDLERGEGGDVPPEQIDEIEPF